ncbi:MAG TPA: extensin family protein [Rhabdaerophilum sp.]|nr:extensin family protein [Rhabdaerophilum sp.]
MLRFDHASPLAFPLPHRMPRLLLAMAGIGAFLSGCGFVKFEPREPWRAEAELACMKSGVVRTSELIRPTKPIDGPGPCGADLPLKVSAFQNDPQAVAVALASTGAPQQGFAQGIVELTVMKPEATLGCPMVAWTDDWIAGSVQPAALAWFSQSVKEIRTAGSYACRRRNHRANARLSEHAFGNAVDVMSFVMSDGNVITVKGGWRGTEQEQGFLRDVFHGACQRFKTVLGPGSDALHYDHFHLDLARHDARGQRRYCKPMVAAPQRPSPGSFGPGTNPWGGPQNPYAYRAPVPGLPLPSATTDMLASRGTVPAPAPAPRPRDDFDVENGGNKEVEPDFDPKEFDLNTGAIGDLPRARRLPPLKSVPPTPIEANEPPDVAKPPRRASRVYRPEPLPYDPAGK